MDLASKTLSELKTCAALLGVNPSGDRRLKQTWILAIEAATGDRASEPHEVQRQEPIESKFGRIVYRKLTIAQLPETSPGVEDIQGQNNAEPNGTGTEQIGADEIAIGAGIHQQCLHSTQPDGNSSSIEIETLGSQKCDRVLAAAGDSQTNQRRFLPDQSDELAIAIFTDEQPPNRGDGRGGRLESESKVSQSAIELAAKTSLSVDRIQKPKSIAHELLELFKSSLDHALACEVEEIPEAILFEGRANETYPVTFSARFISESGTLTISGTDYETVRAQAEELLELHQAEAKLMPTIKNLTAQIDIKERDIQRLNDKISTATKQLRRLENFLKSLGIDPQSQTLSYVPRLAEEFKKYGAADEAIAEVVEHDPIPFRLEEDEDEDEDEDKDEF